MSSPLRSADGDQTRAARLGRLGRFALLNLVIGLVVSRSLAALGGDAVSATAVLLAWVGTVGAVVLLGWIVSAPLALLRAPRALAVGACTLFALLQIALYADTVIYGLFRLHYNRMVWLALTGPGAADSLRLGTATVVSATLAILGIVAAELAALRLAWRTPARWSGPRPLLAAAALVLLLIAADKALYAWGDLRNHTGVTRVARLFPFYQRLTIRRFALARGWFTPHEVLAPPTRPALLRYPRDGVRAPDTPPPYDVVVIAIEGCRADMLDPRVMPRLHAFAQRRTTCADHWSGGNATRFGIFSLLYGIHATYWQAVLAERQGPFLLGELSRLGYRLAIESCTDLDFPEFRRTAFVAVPQAIHDRWDPALPRVERDRLMTDRVVDFLAGEHDRPSFCFAFYDASHAIYLYPPEHEVFTPALPEAEVDFIDVSRTTSREALVPLFNRYRNSLHYVDAQIGRVLDQLERSGRLERTLVFVCGDHGEAFGELGSIGHNGTFDPYQARTVMVASVPGLAPGKVSRITSHIDVVPTILAALGYEGLDAVSQGVPLGAASTRTRVVCASWDTMAIIDDEAILVLGTEAYNPTLDLYDRLTYRPLRDPDRALGARRPGILDLTRALAEFSR